MISEPPTSSIADVTVVISTFNRKLDAVRAVRSALAQRDCKIEVIVYDNASTDGTSEYLADMFKDSRLRIVRNETDCGYIVNRNRGFKEANAQYILSLDDDAYFQSEQTVARALLWFSNEPNAGALALAYVEPLNRQSISTKRNPFRALGGDALSSYIGTAHLIRRDLALMLGGYREFYVHQHEERDLCIRLQDAGYQVIYAETPPIVHLVSPKRDSARITEYAARNQVLFEFLNAPFPYLTLRLARVPLGVIAYRFNLSSLPAKLRGLLRGFWCGLVTYRKSRNPVTRETYARFRKMSGHGPVMTTETIETPML